MAIPAKHQQFIDLVAKGSNQVDAYRATVGKKTATANSAKSKASNLAKKYAKEIEFSIKRVSAMVEAAYEKKIDRIASKEVFTKLDKMEFLRKVALGEIKIPKQIILNGEITTIQIEADYNDRVKAIAELNKMEGDYAATKQELSVNQPMIINWNGDNTDKETA